MAELTPAKLASMNNEQLKSNGYVRVPGFTKKDGTKVKAHVRKINPGFTIGFLQDMNDKYVAEQLNTKSALIYNNKLHVKVGEYIAKVKLKKVIGKSNNEINKVIAEKSGLSLSSVKKALEGKDVSRALRAYEKKLARKAQQQAASRNVGSSNSGSSKSSSGSNTSSGSSGSSSSTGYSDKSYSTTTPTKTQG